MNKTQFFYHELLLVRVRVINWAYNDDGDLPHQVRMTVTKDPVYSKGDIGFPASV